MGKKILICFICILGIIGFCVNDSRITLGAGRIIYTAATKGNSDTSGNGTKINPYNLFETALANANDGDMKNTAADKDADNTEPKKERKPRWKAEGKETAKKTKKLQEKKAAKKAKQGKKRK
jgi:hypothetical protein